MEPLLERQQIIAETIRKIHVNFKKDPVNRKTSEYIKKRLDSLLALWGEFKANHEQLELGDKTHVYFTTDVLQNVKQEYETLVAALRSFNPSTSEERGVPSKTDELISQQRTNFRAFSRLIRNINIEKITERWEIEDKLNMLQSRWKLIDENHWQIDNLLVGSDVDYELEYSTQENTYEAIKRQLNGKLNSAVHQYKSVPQIEIPNFSGNYNQWPTFMDLYSEAIHKNMLLTKAQKMQHLKGKLRGEAERIVQHLTVSAENYDTCWDILIHRYNNLHLLFTKQIQTFMNQPTMHSQSAYELKRLHDVSLETIHAIHNLGVDTSTWDPLLVHILTGKMDSETYTNYMESRKAPRELATLNELMDYLENKFTALEPVSTKKQYNKPSNNVPTKEAQSKQPQQVVGKFKQFSSKTFHTSSARTCPICKTNHILIHCKTFNNMTSETKIKTLEQMNICKNCLFSHDGKTCSSHKTCKVCNKPHHTILHDVIRETGCAQTTIPMKSNNMTPSTTTSSSQHKASHVAGNFNEVLLATVLIKVRAADGTYMQLRCLLDQGSQINLITESAVQRLGLQRRQQNGTIAGIGISVNQSHGTVHLICESIYGDYVFSTEALIMAKMLSNLPNYSFEKGYWPHIQNINLADPHYNISRDVDVLLDAGVYAEIVLDGILRGPPETPIAQQTKLGWVLLGNFRTFNCHALLNNIDEISQFWEMEDITSNTRNTTSEEEYCETLYKTTTTRRSDGRYEVKIPMKPNFKQNLGASKPQTVAQFKQLEKRLVKDKPLYESYKKFIDDYLKLGHMKLSTLPREPSCFLPHHGVLKPESTTTKLRVVFNASSKTTSGYTLNQLMECGANLQQDLQTLLLRWRAYEYVYTADIEKFYRQIFIQEPDQQLQKIVWRETEADPIKEYQLCTITYGTKAAPFLAMRTIRQLVEDDGQQYPLAADILSNQLYMDDLLGGNNSIVQAQQAQRQLINILAGGGFNLRKWASNTPNLLEDLHEDLISQNMLDLKHTETNKTLGITWNPQTDQFTFRPAPATHNNGAITKRTLLSDLSKLYDPLGWLSPATTKGKLIFQQAWSSSVDWDDPLPENIQKEWERFEQDRHNIRNIIIPRWIGDTTQLVELHGFSDASEKAYACVIYCKSINKQGQPVIQLVAGKAKLAPLRKHISLPRLELCGALLLSRLMKKVTESIKAQTVKIYGWTDSMVVLGWLQGDQSRWKTFVANRVAQIKDSMIATCWYHVKSEDNAADCASRGLFASQLISHSLWWEGPSWLKNNGLPEQPKTYETREELKTKKHVYSTEKTSQLIEELLHKHSSMSRVTRVLGWVLRFVDNTRNKNSASRLSHLTASDIEVALNIMIKNAQNQDFADEISQIQKHKHVRSTSKIINLNPYLDNNRMLRVGGRLQHADLSQSQKHPVILSSSNRITELLIKQAHELTLHGGARLTLAHLRNRYWILGGMRTVKKQLLRCVKCHRFKTSTNNQLMADLPKPRVTMSRPFTHTGVDFTGQVEVKANKGRGIKITKGYIAIFICLATKAIHLELVSDLSTPAFLAALKRLCARRGTPKHLYSDNGTNFVGAAKTLAKECKEALRIYINNEFLANIADSGIEWHFNAPSWPTAGGLWEAAVKSMKHHLKRVLGEQKLTFEEFTTLLTQIEACLNSRPLVTLTNDVEDLEYLTPGHFLVGGPVLSPPLSADIDNRNITTRWKLTEKMQRDFWKRWSSDYLQTLQGRGKWHHPTKNIEIGDIVLVREENIPPAKWLLGKVIDTHPGADGLVRVVSLKTKNNSNVKRPVTKVARLPIDKVVHQAYYKDDADAAKNKLTTNRRKITSHQSFNNYLCILLTLVIMCITPSAQQLTNVTKLDPSKLIHFDKIADMQIIQDEWKMVVYYNMSTYWKSLANIEKYVNHLNSLCKTEASLLTIAAQFEHELSELNHYNYVLRSEHGRRIRRGLINGIGYVSNYLFGVLDERFAEQYDKDIRGIHENENHLLTLYKQHTSIIEGEYNLLKRNEDVMNKQFIIINQHLKETETRVKQDRETMMYITTTALAANMIISNLRRIQQLLLDLVTDIRSGRVDTHLLKPDEFEHQLNVISGQIPKGLSLPCGNGYVCIREMYKLSRVHVRLTESYLLFEVKIPLINDEQYELARVILIPKIRGSTMANIIPTSEYIATNLKKDLLMYLNLEDISSCLTLTEHQLLCAINKPIHDIKAAASTCEAQIINNRKISSCRTTISHCRDKWIALHSRSAWLYTCCEKCSVRTFCSAKITSYTLNGTGIVSLAEGCILKGDQLSIHGHNNLQNDIVINEEEPYIPDSGINNIIKTTNILHFEPENHEEQFKALHKKIEHVKDQQATLNLQANVTDTHHNVMFGLVTVCGIAVSIWCFMKIKNRCTNRRQEIRIGSLHMNRASEDVSGIDDQVNVATAEPVNIVRLSKVNKSTSPMASRVNVGV